MAKQEVDDEVGTFTTMRSMRTTLSKPCNEEKAVTTVSNSLKLSLHASRGGTNQKPLSGQAISFKTWLSTNLCRGKTHSAMRAREQRMGN